MLSAKQIGKKDSVKEDDKGQFLPYWSLAKVKEIVGKESKVQSLPNWSPIEKDNEIKAKCIHSYQHKYIVVLERGGASNCCRVG